MNKNMARQIEEAEKYRELHREKITRLFQEVGERYAERGAAELNLHQGHDVHAFYRISKDPSKVIHVQGYPGMSSEEKARVWARLMDYNKMMALRERPGISDGNEHEATVQTFPNFGNGIEIPYDSKVLEEKLAENVPQLR